MDITEEHSPFLIKNFMDDKVGLYLDNDPLFGSVINSSQNETMLLTIDPNYKYDEITVSLHPLIQNFNNSQEKTLDQINNESIIISVEDKENILLISSQDNRNQLFPIYSDFIIDIDSNSLTDEQKSFDLVKEKSQQSLPACCRKHEKFFKKSFKKKMRMTKKKNFASINFARLFSSIENDKYLKPKYSHNILCAFAIWSHEEKKMEVSHIYKFLCDCFPYFKTAEFHWKNSLRHSLATCNWFQKSKTHRTPKKGYQWVLNESKLSCLTCEIKKQCVRDISKLYHCLGGEEVCSLLLKMGLIDFDINFAISSM